jgi:hypothetical protein
LVCSKKEEEEEGYSHVVYFNNKIFVLFPFGLSMLSALGLYLHILYVCFFDNVGHHFWPRLMAKA